MLVLCQKLHICPYDWKNFFPVTGTPSETPQSEGARTALVRRDSATILRSDWSQPARTGSLRSALSSGEMR